MSIMSSEIQPFWMTRLNNVTGKQTYGCVEWIVKQIYAIHTPITDSQFTLVISKHDDILYPFAFDCNRLSSAAFETMHFIQQSQHLPKSLAWLVIKSYYAAFFSAHAIIRILGVSCSYLEQQQTKKIDQIANVYGYSQGVKISPGYYKCRYDNSSKQLFCEKASKGGSHENFWQIFCSIIKQLSNNILSAGRSTILSQQVSVKLDEIYRILCNENHIKGNWLSHIRNKVNYRHEFDAWFPYNGTRKQSINKIYSICSLWQQDPMNINLVMGSQSNINLFTSACSFIVGLCRILIQDMSNRCPNGKSYLSYGSVRLLNQVF
jgi:hypothetical protein